MLEIDGKPEKGERKIADDIVILINEMVEEETRQSSDRELWTIYRIGLLEYSLEKSPYNFDIQLALAKIYD